MIRKLIKQFFCFHSNWKPYHNWHPARRFGKYIFICDQCGKIKDFGPYNPPINNSN